MRVWLQGQRFGTVGCRKDDTVVEITTFRADVYHPDSRKPEVQFSDDIETDLSRRDFTVNAMALRLPDPVLVDPFGGAVDLAAHRLRTPLAPEVSFLDDPLRMLRAARFVAQFGLDARSRAHRRRSSRCAHRMEIVSAERIRDELSKLLLVDDPSAGLWFLAETHLSDEFLPELNQMRLEQDPIHTHKDVLAHTIAVVHNTRPELLVRLAALFHDVGKPKTRSFASGGVSFHHHEVVGARMTEERMRALKYPNEIVDAVVKLVYLHLRIHTYAMGWTDKAVRRYVRDAGDLLDELNHLQRCDCTTRNQNRARALQRRMDDLETRIAELREQEELDSIRPPLDGRQVMEHLGVEPGRVVGDALDFLLEARLDEGPIDEAEAYARLDAWAREQGIEPGSVPERQEEPCSDSGAFLAGPPHDGLGHQGAGGLGPGLQDRVDPEAGPAELGEHVADGAGVDLHGLAVALHGDRARLEVGALDRPRRADAQPDRVLVGEHERSVRLQDALHLTEEPRRVVDLGDGVAAERDVDRLGAQEREVGEVTLAPLDLHLGPFRARARLGETRVRPVERDDHRALVGEGDRRRAGAAAQVEHALAAEVAEQLELAIGESVVVHGPIIARRAARRAVPRRRRLLLAVGATRRWRTAPPCRGPRRRGTAPRATS